MLDINIKGTIPKNMEDRGLHILSDNLGEIENILNQRKMPKKGLSDEKIELLLTFLSNMDTDKDPKAIRVGEREARISSEIHKKLSSNFCHGIGRSGNLVDPQPKAPGASAMYALTNKLLESFLKNLNVNVNALATPVSTGMSIALCLSALKRGFLVENVNKNVNKNKDTKIATNITTNITKKQYSKYDGANVVIYPYASHKSPIKSTSFAGMRMRFVETQLSDRDDCVEIPVEDIISATEKELKAGNNPVILSTLTFFPPRRGDDIEEISKYCLENNIPHIINGAYAIQNHKYLDKLKKALKYRVDAIVSSTDKNLMTPIGGGIIYSKNKDFLREVSLTYPGRASATPIVNTFVSLLSLGMDKYTQLMKEQVITKNLLDDLLIDLANKTGNTKLNVDSPIASCITTQKDPVDVSAKLYNLRITGPRGIKTTDHFGNCYMQNYKYNYVVMNASIGVKESDVNNAVDRLSKVI
ncbi:O-phosphoseryl-tRNA(Sec) selenium transferase [Methanococcus voltae]|uniref:O-phosphoseryl-tRNA(Sec) selenium transferase n=1 Tax=Methanococcus voltae (strain ATCC BAA-1334 / A3) TaxID=456320 RepID=D7DS07_METV3|nr:O-phosphoseryl-tRNA(Sec) selenium transferase [Methanococcus voltae]MCS3901442.1 O-phospho-L-seryl-tRNASec:L-selenocysteinyl-tRNA synthase [Methanococcus voltae]